jgi:putative endonuclease
MRLVAHNFRCRRGEIDLVMWDAACLVFVEVRYRRNDRYGSGAESIDRHKRGRIVACARAYLQRHPALSDRPARFDVVSVSLRGEERQIEWIPDAFTV